MTVRTLAGVFAPITTPFDPATGDVALAHLQRNAARLFAEGLDGLIVGGSTGEAPLLDAEEQQAIVAAVRRVVPEDKWLVVGTGAESTRQAVALTRTAAAAGADAVLVRPPGYFGPAHSPASLADYYRAVADASSVPVLAYNIPKYTHVALGPDLIATLAGHANVIGAKDSSGDLKHLAAYRNAAPRWALFVGSGSLLCAALELGCTGGIVAIGCFAARQCVALYAAFAAGDRARAAVIQERLVPLDEEINGRFGPAGIKAAMDAVGLYGGPVRAPLPPLSEPERRRIAALVAGD
ncbi:MAG: dihydrodipicolinate synthase family protein [Gemmatimonadales bacterium]